MFQLKYVVPGMGFVNYIVYNMVVDTQFHKFYGRPFARVPCLFLMKDRDRSVTPLGVTRVNRTILQADYFGYYVK